MALVYVDGNDPCLVEYEACEKLFREIMQLFTQCDKEPKNYANLSANIRLQMKQFSREVQQLKLKVEEAARTKVITAEEAERRMRQVEQLQSKEVQLHILSEQRRNNFATSRANLLNSSSAFADGGMTSWAVDDDDDDDDDQPIDVHVSIDDLKVQQQRTLQEQEKGLEELCKVIVRQKEIGQAISNEVDQQNEIIDDLADHMERTDGALINRTRDVESISKKDRTCGYWIVIIVLFIAIIVVTVV